MSELTARGTLPAAFDRERAAVDDALHSALADGPDRVPASLGEPLRHAVAAGGKRIRPVLCAIAYHATRRGPPSPFVYRVAAAVELIHTYSLMHDDLPCMDDDELRRGRPTAHRVFGEAAAAAAGAACIALAFAALDAGARALGLAAERRRASIGVLARAAGGGGMVGGQFLDLEAEGRTLGVAALQAVHAAKTGALFAAAAQLGGIAADADRRVVEALDDYGAALGLAFQIADDVLDETGHGAVLGKTAGRDRARQKATFPAVLGLTPAQRRARAAADDAIDALRGAEIVSIELEQLAHFAAERDR